MIRTFQTHHIRESRELTGSLWEFSPCQGEHAGEVYQVATPCCWESHPDFSAYRGRGIYKTSFAAGGTIRLEFKGISHTAVVYLDDREIVSHYNAYTIFDAVVPDLEEGIHTLTIQADNRFSENSALHIPNDYMSYGGVNRPVVLERIPDAYIEWVHVTPYYREGAWHAEVQVKVRNLSPQKAVRDVRAEAAGQSLTWDNVEIPAKAERILEAEARFDDVRAWSAEDPQLYYVTAVLERDGAAEDDLIDRFGFRQITRSLAVLGPMVPWRRIWISYGIWEQILSVPLIIPTMKYFSTCVMKWESLCGRKIMPGGSARRICGIQILRSRRSR